MRTKYHFSTKSLFTKILIYLLCTLFPLASLGSNGYREGPIEIIQPTISVPIGEAKAVAGYLSIKNHGTEKITLLKVKSNVGRTMLHKTETDSKGIVRMKHVRSIDIEPGNVFKMERGGFHVMIVALKNDIKQGDIIPAFLFFSGNLRIKINFVVE